jgi:sulfite oxidase
MKSRRAFFAMAAGGMLAAQNKRDMKVLSVRPEDLEMPLSGFSDYITPIEHFFVRTHVYAPAVDLNSWKLEVAGEVATPLTLTMADLRRMPPVELVAVLECAGNGRSYYEPTVPGLQWRDGSVGNGRWRGVRLADVLKRAGIKASAVDIEFDGADVPIGKMPDFRRSIPVKKALDPNTLLAYEMNGETLPVKHGFPLRVISPGWASDSWVKWVTSITVLDKESESFWMKSAYRRPDFPVEPGTAVPPEKMKPVTSLRVKSLITSPSNGSWAAPGKEIAIHGTAWSGDSGPVTRVDCSVDNGQTWQPAKLNQNQVTRFGWRQWQFEFTPSTRDVFTIVARAVDTNGDTQPLAQEWNPSGYGWNVAPRVQISSVSRETSSGPSGGIQMAPVSSREFERACMSCHGEDVIRQQHLTRAQWDREINKMTGWGAEVKADDRASFLDFLEKNFGPRK